MGYILKKIPVFLLFIFIASPAKAQADTEKLNVVFILADDLGWSDLSGYGSDLHETPNLDRLAKQGLKFTNAYAAAPICTPSRASIMTGKFPARLHMTTWHENSGTPAPNNRDKLMPPATIGNLPLEETTIAEAFQQAGYFTAHVGKWHLGDAAHYPQTHGFDVNIGGTMWGAPDTYWSPYRGQKFQNEYRYIPDLREPSPKGNNKGPNYLTDVLTDKAVEIIKKKNNAPFFLNLWYHTVHTPIEGKPELVKYYKNRVKPGMKDQNYEYAAMVSSLDENIGRILKAIADAGISDKTIIIFFSDNGGRIGKYKDWETVANNAPLRSGKGSLYEGGIREPLIVKWPGITKAGTSCDFPVISNDFFPTLMEIAAIKKTRTNLDLHDGVSLMPVLKNPKSPLKRETLYWHSPHYYTTTSPVSAIREGNWKLIHFFEDDHLELYDLDRDLGEQNNLVDTHPEKATNLYNTLKSWRKDINAQFPSYNPLYVPKNW
ncbi:MAG: sulfatase [Flavobacteriaceae bacterium]